uniref:Predicted protein n=1 Tax=Hordeum vulgare subsp. vulgare TaxID=112509 RepID=F2CWB2_HORVV|nr:predicted protein [Hordeum vulgare subsp. vulgare]
MFFSLPPSFSVRVRVCGRRARPAGGGRRRRRSPLHGSVMECVLILLSMDQGAFSLPSLLSLGFDSLSSRPVPLFMFVLQAYPLDPCGVGGDDAVRVLPSVCMCSWCNS